MGGTLMMNPTRFCGALFLFFFSAIAAALAGQSKPSAPAGQPVNLFKEVLDHKGQIQWKAAPPPGIPAAVILERQTVSEMYFFLVSPDGSLQKAAYLQQGNTSWLPIATSLAKPVFEKDRSDWHDWVMKLGAGGK